MLSLELRITEMMSSILWYRIFDYLCTPDKMILHTLETKQKNLLTQQSSKKSEKSVNIQQTHIFRPHPNSSLQAKKNE